MRARDAPSPDSSLSAAIETIERLLALGAREDARRRAAALAAAFPDRAEPILLQARIERADGVPERARSLLVAARVRLPVAARPALDEALR